MSLIAAMRKVIPDLSAIGSPSHQPTGLSRLLAHQLRLTMPLMAYQSTFDSPDRDTNAFYRRTLHVLSDARVPFLVGGSHAFLTYTGIVRETKDFDLFVRRDELEAGLAALRDAGYETGMTFPHWLAKAKHGADVVDLVFR